MTVTKEKIWKTRKATKRTSDFCDDYGVSTMTIWRWVRDGRLPPPQKINGRNYWPGNVEPLTDDEVA